MKKDIHLILQDDELVDLCRILIDGDPEGALVFLRQHLRGRARELLEGG